MLEKGEEASWKSPLSSFLYARQAERNREREKDISMQRQKDRGETWNGFCRKNRTDGENPPAKSPNNSKSVVVVVVVVVDRVKCADKRDDKDDKERKREKRYD